MRCFVAAWPDAATRDRCAGLIDTIRPHAEHGRMMRAENLHLTFAFIGNLPDDVAVHVAAACAQQPIAPCEWQLDAIGFFARPRVLWAGGPLTAELEAIAASVRSLLDRLDVQYDRKPFVPHLTLLRDVRRYAGPRTIEPSIAWPIGAIALYRSGRDDAGARYFRVEPA